MVVFFEYCVFFGVFTHWCVCMGVEWCVSGVCVVGCGWVV